jgi:hypothetical protein
MLMLTLAWVLFYFTPVKVDLVKFSKLNLVN